MVAPGSVGGKSFSFRISLLYPRTILPADMVASQSQNHFLRPWEEIIWPDVGHVTAPGIVDGKRGVDFLE